jgi:hypothetical protein
MTTFDEREKSFENKYKHDQELQFKVEVRRNKLLGLWIGGLMGLNEAESKAYAKEVIESDFEEAGVEDVVRKIMTDCAAKNVELSEHRLRKHIDEFTVEAKKQIMSE